MNWYHRSVVEMVKALLEGLYVPDPSSSLLISPQANGAIDPEEQLYWDITLKIFPSSQGNSFGASDVRGGIVIALREAISEMSLPEYVWVETIDDNSWRFGRLHGMRRVTYERSITDRCMIALQTIANHFVQAGIRGFINLHFLVASIVCVFLAIVQSEFPAAVTVAVFSLAIVKDKDWRSLQKRRLASWVEKREGWPESETKYRKRLSDSCADPDEWESIRLFVKIKILNSLLRNILNRYYKWNASRRPSIRLAMMGANNASS